MNWKGFHRARAWKPWPTQDSIYVRKKGKEAHSIPANKNVKLPRRPGWKDLFIALVKKRWSALCHFEKDSISGSVRGIPRFELGTSRTRSENHTTRPNPRYDSDHWHAHYSQHDTFIPQKSQNLTNSSVNKDWSKYNNFFTRGTEWLSRIRIWCQRAQNMLKLLLRYSSFHPNE